MTSRSLACWRPALDRPITSTCSTPVSRRHSSSTPCPTIPLAPKMTTFICVPHAWPSNLTQRARPPALRRRAPVLAVRCLVTAHVVHSGQLVRGGGQLPSEAIAERVAGLEGLAAGGVAGADEDAGRSKEVRIRRQDLVGNLTVEVRKETERLVLGYLEDLTGVVEFADGPVRCNLLVDKEGEWIGE